jgi:hypothetical protein
LLLAKIAYKKFRKQQTFFQIFFSNTKIVDLLLTRMLPLPPDLFFLSLILNASLAGQTLRDSPGQHGQGSRDKTVSMTARKTQREQGGGREFWDRTS